LNGNTMKLRGGLVATDGSREILFEKICNPSEGVRTGALLGEQVLNTGGRELLIEIREKQKL
jgi:hypothetical protein